MTMEIKKELGLDWECEVKSEEQIKSCVKKWEGLEELIQDGAPVQRDIGAWIDALDWVLGRNRHDEPNLYPSPD